MQHDPTKVDLNYQNNTYPPPYPPANQPPLGAHNIYQPYQTPSPYLPYPQQPIGGISYVTPSVQYYGQTPSYPQQNVVIVPTYHPLQMTQILTTMTPNLRAFFIISGIIYIIWSLSAIGLEIFLIIESYSTYYRGIWAGAFLLGGGICMLYIACQKSYSMIYLIRICAPILFFCVLGLVLSAVNYGASVKCSSKLLIYISKYSCDEELISILKITMLCVFIAATIHTFINIIVFNNQYKKTLLNTNAPREQNY